MQATQSTTQKKERLIDVLMGNEAWKRVILDSFPSGGVDIDTLKTRLPKHFEVNVKNKGMASAGYSIKDKNTGDTVYIKEDMSIIICKPNSRMLVFAFISKALYKHKVGPLCKFLYNKDGDRLITLSAQLGYSKSKKFTEFDRENNAPEEVFDKAQQIARTFHIRDVNKDSNIGITDDGDNEKVKIFDFLPPFTWSYDDYQKSALIDGGDLIKLFRETLDDENIQELLKVMPTEPKEELDTYCKAIVGLGIDELKVINPKAQKEVEQKEANALHTHYNTNPSKLEFDNIGSNKYGQIGTPSKPKEGKTQSSWLDCLKSQNNKVGVEI